MNRLQVCKNIFGYVVAAFDRNRLPHFPQFSAGQCLHWSQMCRLWPLQSCLCYTTMYHMLRCTNMLVRLYTLHLCTPCMYLVIAMHKNIQFRTCNRDVNMVALVVFFLLTALRWLNDLNLLATMALNTPFPDFFSCLKDIWWLHRCHANAGGRSRQFKTL